MPEQMELIEWGGRRFEPTADGAEPKVWVRELRILEEFKPDATIKTFRLRQGMNIVWARSFAGAVRLGQSGLSGHAAGKTTFCRFIRYVLGEQNLGTREFREALAARFPTVTVLADVRVDGQSWLVCRSPAFGHHDFVCRGENLDQVFEVSLDRLPYRDFLHAVNSSVTPHLSSRKLPMRGIEVDWSFLLPWLSRDQECRHAHLLEWRSSDSESGAPETPCRDAAHLIRSVCLLVSHAEEAAAAEHEGLKDSERKLGDDIPKLKYRLEIDKSRLAKALPSIMGETGELFSGAAIEKIDQELAALSKQSDDLSESPAVMRAEADLARISAELVLAKDVLAREEHDLDDYRSTLNALRHNQQDTADADFKARGLDVADGKCNVPLDVALRHCDCARDFHRIDFASGKALASQQEKIAAWEEAVPKYEKRVQDRKTIVLDLQRKRDAAGRDLAESKKASNQTRHELLRKEETLRALGSQLQQLKESAELLTRTTVELESTRKAVRESSGRLDAHRKAHRKRRGDLAAIFEDVLKAVLGNDISASVDPQAERIKLTADLRGQRNSAATETVKILAFDLACMLYACEGKAAHPRLLIHDSPREADMSPDIYQRFFLYMHQMEACFTEGREPNYQYIVTTTEPPPSALQKEPWLRLVLDASTPEGRILGVDL